MIHKSISFKISVNRYYFCEMEIVLWFLVAVIMVSGLTDLFLLLIIFGLLSTILLIIIVLSSMTERQKRFNIITFNPTWIEIGRETSIRIENTDIQKILLHYRFTKGDKAKIRTMTGQENTIKIITKDGKKIVRNIWCENDSDYWRLRSLGSFFKERGVKVKMKGFWREWGT